ncbi:MAG: hypothetical protein ACOYN3_01055 [Acidimicrobiia bacterium]
MNTPLPPDPGPYGPDTDDAITALIDGELAGFAADTGRSVDEVRTTLEQWGGLEARRARLLTAREAMATPVAFDDPLGSELVAAALAAVPNLAPVVALRARRSRRIAWILSGAAIALVAMVGIGMVIGNRNSTPTAQQSSLGPELQPATAGGISRDDTGASATQSIPSTTEASAASTPTTTPDTRASLGEISDPLVLRNRIQGRLNGNNNLTSSTTGGSSSTTVAPSEPCAGVALFPSGSTIVLRTPATLSGQRVEVVAATAGATTLVVVLDPASCSVLRALTL